VEIQLPNVQLLKSRVCDEVDALEKEITEVSDWLYDHPELGSEEYESAKYLTAILERNGFKVETGTADIPTAFTASNGRDSPRITFLAEYDALPGIGHGCGHNMIAASALGAGIAVSRLRSDLQGTVMVIGTPDEEGRGKYAGSKALLAKAGVYRGIDAVLMMHGLTRYAVGGSSLAVKDLIITFRGRTSHAAASPEKGINALDAAILTFVGVNTLRQHVRRDANVVIHGIMAEGGQASNVIPDLAVVKYGARSSDTKYVLELIEKIKSCARGAGMATGAKVSFDSRMPMYEAIKNNPALEDLVARNLRSLGAKVPDPAATRREMPRASTDFGNVTQLVPAVNIGTKICSKNTPGHSTKFRDATKTTQGQKGLMTATKTMAMSAVELMADRAALRRVKTEE
jgi:amidohydrolase